MSNEIKVRDMVIGGETPKICMPVTGRDEADITMQAKKAVQMSPDLIEWRADYYCSRESAHIIDLLCHIRDIVDNIPLVFTFRTKQEGGEKAVSNEEYTDLLISVAKSGYADLIDVEVISKIEIANKIIDIIHKNRMGVIGSYHNFHSTPSFDEMKSILKRIEDSGADICKMAVMPHRISDVERLIGITKYFHKNSTKPVITMSMSDMGAVSRVSGITTGSAVTFAAGVEASAPGQLNIHQIRNIYSTVHDISYDYNIMLIGFMGTGKTTVSRALKNITGLEEIDMDSYIESKEGMSISDIFSINGEKYFRDKETEALKEIQATKGKIVSCGGGVVIKKENINLMKKGGVTVLLTASADTIYQRIRHSASRPLLNGNMNVEHIEELMSRRREMYMNAADILVATDGKNIVDICEEILSKLPLHGKNS